MCPQFHADRRARTMLPLLIVVLAPLVRGAIVADPPTSRFDQLYEKLEKFTPTHPPESGIPERLVKLYKKLERFSAPQTERPVEKLYEKLDRLNSLTPDKFFSDDDEELLDAMQEWGMSDEQIDAVIKGIQRRPESEEYGDWIDEDLQDLTDDDYAMDGSEDMDPEEEENQDPPSSTTSKGSTTNKIIKIAPSALNRLEPEPTAVPVLDPIEATKERPKIMDDSGLSKVERALLRREAFTHIATVLKKSKCLLPQPRWLSVRQLAPSADTHYLPPCVQLHRCAPDSGCCSEANVCAPVDGHYVSIPLILDKVGKLQTVARMRFFNHTRCECLPRESLENPRVRPPRRETTVAMVTSTQPAVRATERGSPGNPNMSDVLTQEPENETTAPPQLRRCTCPTLFMARVSDSGCACVCDWPDPTRSRDCHSLARGREHFGLKDRVCVADGSCSEPTCVFGSYEKNLGRCPLRRYRRIRFRTRRFPLKIVV